MMRMILEPSEANEAPFAFDRESRGGTPRGKTTPWGGGVELAFKDGCVKSGAIDLLADRPRQKEEGDQRSRGSRNAVAAEVAGNREEKLSRQGLQRGKLPVKLEWHGRRD